VMYFNSGRGNSLKVMMQPEKGIKKEISSALY